MSSVTRRPLEIIPMDEIKPGTYVRYAEKNGRQYVAVRDLIMVANDVSSVMAGNVWRSVFDMFRDDITLHSTSFFFSLKSDTGIKVWESVITFQGAMKLLALLPRAGHMNEGTCKERRATMVKILTEYHAGEEPLLAQTTGAVAVAVAVAVPKPGTVTTTMTPVAATARANAEKAATARANAEKAATARANAEKAATARPSTAPPSAPVGAVAAAKPKPKSKSKNSASEKLRDEVEMQKELYVLDIAHEKAKIALQLEFLKSARKEMGVRANPFPNPWYPGVAV
jgi:hypothetical protein